MRDPNTIDETPNSLSNRDKITMSDDASLSDSDPEESSEAIGRKVEDLTSSSDEEDNTIQSSNVPQGTSKFSLTGGSCGFSYRSKNIFDQLDSTVKLKSTPLAEDNIMDGAFARPAPPSPPPTQRKREKPDKSQKASAAKKVPDYLLHPERWTRYDLDDVPETSDKKNSQVAHQFIQDLQARKRARDGPAESFSPAFNQGHSSKFEHKIIFSKPGQASKGDGGQKSVRSKAKEIGLVHLNAGLEEEEGDKLSSRHQDHSGDAGKTKRKHVQEHDEDSEEGMAGNVTFNSGKKVNRKHFRKSVDEEDDN